MSAFLIVPFLLACVVGGWVAWRVPLDAARGLAVLILILGTAATAGALTVAAEAGSAMARYLGLAALLLTSAALSGAFIAARRADRAQRTTEQP